MIVKESDHFHAEGMSSAAFRHGPFEMLGSETFVLVFAGDAKTRDLNQRLLDDIRQQEGRAELVDKDASLPCCRIAEHGPSIRQILEILPVQMITLALAATGWARAWPLRACDQSDDDRVEARRRICDNGTKSLHGRLGLPDILRDVAVDQHPGADRA